MTATQNDKLLNIATCERCNFLPAQYEIRQGGNVIAYCCEGCTVEQGIPLPGPTHLHKMLERFPRSPVTGDVRFTIELEG